MMMIIIISSSSMTTTTFSSGSYCTLPINWKVVTDILGELAAFIFRTLVTEAGSSTLKLKFTVTYILIMVLPSIY
jgi:hypothetical protein